MIQQASAMGLLRTILIILLIYFGIKIHEGNPRDQLKHRQPDKMYHFLSKITGFLYKIDDYSAKT